MKEKSLSLKEVEELSYYDFMSYLGASFFQIGGPSSTLRLAKQCHIGNDSRVLEVGCGTGYNAALITKKFGCIVVGVDIAQLSIKKARERAKHEGLTDRLDFQIGNAYNLSFDDESFDVVITEFVSQFLDMKKALNEFMRVLKPGGHVGINEMYKESDIPNQPAMQIHEAEELIAKLTELPFKLNTPEHWRNLFEEAGLVEVELNKSREFLGLRDSHHIIREMGGFREILKVMWRMLKYWILSKKSRSRFRGLQKVKSVFLRKKSTSPHVGYILGSGKKP
ncbi:MAG: methyltransferase domain-containing protein [Candidatus Hodarchaeales archaeon]|jgi:ubiquinone/menaquinone biosynthesis C-methylase UbiE